MRGHFGFEKGGGCLVDIETTGLSLVEEEITEVAVIRVDGNLNVVAEMTRLIRVSKPVPWRIMRLTGITDAMLEQQGRPLAEVLEEVHGFVGGIPSLAHNARFDRGFLDASAARAALPVRFRLDCSIPVFKRLLPGRRRYGLSALAEDLRVSSVGAHRALADCRTLLGCLRAASGRETPRGSRLVP